jgi:hypothetical protein
MAFNIEFNRTFNHRPWTDRKDRVKADGADGFNVRFKALEEDLDTLRERFKEVSAALNTVATAAPNRVIAVSPIFSPIRQYDNPTLKYWTTEGYGAALNQQNIDVPVFGVAPVSMPAAGSITSFTVTGTNTGSGELSLYISRLDPDTESFPERRVIPPWDIPSSTRSSFNVTKPIDPVRVDPRSCYFIYAWSRKKKSDDSIVINTMRIGISGS